MNIQTSVIKGHKMRFCHYINPHCPTLISIPGNLQEIKSMTCFNKQFSKYYNYYILELPGMGRTAPLHPSYRLEYVSECLDEFIRFEVRSNFTLIACSYSTAIALDYAQSNANKIQNLILAGSMLEIPTDNWITIFKMMANCLENPHDFANIFLESLTSSDNENIPKVKAIKRVVMHNSKYYSRDELWCFIYNSIRLMSYRLSGLEKITCSTLCLTGEHDPYVTPVRCKELAHALPNAIYREIKNADHLFFLEQFEETMHEILDFLNPKTQAA